MIWVKKYDKIERLRWNNSYQINYYYTSEKFEYSSLSNIRLLFQLDSELN